MIPYLVPGCYGPGMRNGISFEVSGADRERLAAVVAGRGSRQKHVWRAAIILATAEGCGTAEIMRRVGVSKPCVWRWQRRFMEAGVDGLLRDKARKPGKTPIAEGGGDGAGRANPGRAARRDHALD